MEEPWSLDALNGDRTSCLAECGGEEIALVARTLIDRWQFPLYSLDLSLTQVDLESLREKQKLCVPDW